MAMVRIEVSGGCSFTPHCRYVLLCVAPPHWCLLLRLLSVISSFMPGAGDANGDGDGKCGVDINGVGVWGAGGGGV